MDWLYATIAGVIIALIGVIWKMLNDKIERYDKALWNQVGRDSFSGMRKMVHEESGTARAFMEVDKRVDRLEKWRNGKP